MRYYTVIALAFAALFLFGCSSDKVSASEEQKMRDAVKGKNVGPMPEETRKAMEDAMRKANMGAGAPKVSPPAASPPTP